MCYFLLVEGNPGKPPVYWKKFQDPEVGCTFSGKNLRGCLHRGILENFLEFPLGIRHGFGEVSQGNTKDSVIYHRMGSPGEPPA